jgi:GH24 family phage-related lysozyme (muramidase)
VDHAAALALLGPFEGRIPHMYLDTEGYVTVGIGNMLPNAAAAVALRWEWRDDPEGEDPSAVAIAADFSRVSGAVPGLRADAYRPLTRLVMPDPEIEVLFRRRVDEFVRRLERHYPLFGEWPEPAQFAVLDMAFNLGAGALPRKWPMLSRALRAMDWREAAKHSHRPGSRDERNAKIAELFLAAAV